MKKKYSVGYVDGVIFVEILLIIIVGKRMFLFAELLVN